MDMASSQVTTSAAGVSKRIVFSKTPPTSTYLICFVIGDFDFMESNRLQFSIRVYAVRGAKLQHGSNMLKVAVDALDRYQQLFGLEYPLPKLEMIPLATLKVYEGAGHGECSLVWGEVGEGLR
jgi:aminopeptidase 2